MLKTQDIVNEASDYGVYIRGKNLFQEWNRRALRVLVQELPDGTVDCNAIIQGTQGNKYTSRLQLSLDDGDTQIMDYSCTCPAYESYCGMCKHCVALALFFRNQQVKSSEKARSVRSPCSISTSSALSSVMASYAAMSGNAQLGLARGSVRIRPILDCSSNYYSVRRWKLSLEIGNKRMYVVKSQTMLLHNVLTGEYFSYGRQLAFHHTREVFDEQSQGTAA